MTTKAIIVQLLDAVVAQINDPDMVWSQTFTAEKRYATERGVEACEELQVDVTPRRITSELADRETEQGDYEINVILRRQCQLDDVTGMEDLLLVSEELQKFSVSRATMRPPTFEDAVRISANPPLVYFPDDARSLGLFTTVIVMTYRIHDEEEA